jgi:hypothetical protein
VIILLVLAPTVLPGQVKVSYEPLDYAAFAAAVAPRLAQIATDFRAGHEKLKERSGAAGAPYPAEEVEALLSSAETQVLATLEPQELAPLRDSIRLRFRRIRRELGAIAPVQSGGFAFASLRVARANSGRLLLRKLVDPLLDDAGAVLQRLVTRAEERRFSLRLCVVSRPDAGATFRMRPPEYREGVQSGKTVLDFPQVALGYYFYKVEARKKKLPPIECGWEGGGEDDQCLDLWDSSGDQVFVCDFSEDKRGCKLQDLPPGGCPAS